MDKVLPKTVEEIVNKKPSRAPLGPNGAPEMGHIAAYMEMLDDFNTLKGKTPPAVFEEAKKEYLDMQPGDVSFTSADTSKLENWINFKPSTTIELGISKFVDWYKNFYQC